MTDHSPVINADLIAVLVAITNGEPRVLTIQNAKALPSGPFEFAHRSLQSGLRTWDRYPSGRLCIEITDPTQYRWNDQNLVGRWYDRKTKSAEDYLSEAIVALAGAAALAKHRRAEAEKQARIRAEQEELWRREKARRERDLKRREYLAKKAEAYESYCRLMTLQTVFGPQAKENGDDQFNRIANVLQKLIETEGRQFESTAIADEVINLKLFFEDDEI